MLFTIVIHQEGDSAYGVTIPDMPGCFSAGDTLEEALDNVREAIDLHMEEVVTGHEAVPTPSPMGKIVNDPDKEALNKSPSKMNRKAHGTQKARHNMELGESSSTAQRSDSLEQAFMQCFHNAGATFFAVDIDMSKYLGKADKINITLPRYLIERIDHAVSEGRFRSRSGMLAELPPESVRPERPRMSAGKTTGLARRRGGDGARRVLAGRH